jgi:DNA-directed RNA polymerase sigma subunit (sigma70/sigma32)
MAKKKEQPLDQERQLINTFEVTAFINHHKERAKYEHRYQLSINKGKALGVKKYMKSDVLLESVLHKNAIIALQKYMNKLLLKGDELSLERHRLLEIEIEYIREKEKKDLRAKVEIMLTMERRYHGSIEGEYRLSEIGRCFWVSRERARQVYDAAMKKIGNPATKRILKKYKSILKD